jgi:hypothetical protein
MVPPGPAATPPRRSGVGGGPGPFHPPPPYPYDYENMSPGTPYSAHGVPPPTHSPYPPYYRGGGGPPPPHSEYWGGSGGEASATPSHHRGGGYWGPPPPHSGPYHEGFRMGPPPMRGNLSPYPHHRSPMRRPYVSPGEPLSPQHPYDQQRKDFRPPAPAAFRGSGRKDEDKEREKIDPDATGETDTDKKNGDPLSVLADVSAGMGGKDKKKDDYTNEGSSSAEGENFDKAKKTIVDGNVAPDPSRPPVPVPAPTSPLQRRTKPSPITPSQTPYERKGGSGASIPAATPGRHQPITPSRSQDSASLAAGGSWGEAPSIPPGVSSEASYPPPEYPPHSQGPYTPVRSRGRQPFGGDLPPPSDSPALVERGSFDSHGDSSSYRAPPYPPSTPPSRAFFYDDGPPPGYGSGNGGSYWEAAGPSPYSPSYHPPSRGGPGAWNQPPPPGSHHEPYYGMTHGLPPPDYPHGPPRPHYGEEDLTAMGPGGHYGPPHHHYRGPPQAHHPHPGMHPPPYGYMHQPRIEEKTILRKKFSWKHYPEVSKRI